MPGNYTEYENGKFSSNVSIKGNFIEKGKIFNDALPAANNDLLTTDIEPTYTPSFLEIYVVISIAGKFHIRRDVSGTVITEILNNDVNLTANAAHSFTIPWRTGDTINFQYSTTGGTILNIHAIEIGGVV